MKEIYKFGSRKIEINDFIRNQLILFIIFYGSRDLSRGKLNGNFHFDTIAIPELPLDHRLFVLVGFQFMFNPVITSKMINVNKISIKLINYRLI